MAFHSGRKAPIQSEGRGLGCDHVTRTSAHTVQFSGAVATTVCARAQQAYANSSSGRSKRNGRIVEGLGLTRGRFGEIMPKNSEMLLRVTDTHPSHCSSEQGRK